MSERPRKPATFKLDDPGVVVMDPDETARPARGAVRVTPEADRAVLAGAIALAHTAIGVASDEKLRARLMARA